MTAADILRGLHQHRNGAAMVTEVVMEDPEWRRAENEYRAAWNLWVRSGLGIEAKPSCPTGIRIRRIDALLVTSAQRTAIEIKVSRADFRRETEEKRLAWRSVVHRFVYACPEGVIQPEEVPDGCGLWWFRPRERSPDLFELEVKRRAKIQKDPAPIPDQVHLALFYRASWKPGDCRDAGMPHRSSRYRRCPGREKFREKFSGKFQGRSPTKFHPGEHHGKHRPIPRLQPTESRTSSE